MPKEKQWITTIDGEEMCIEVEVSWTREQEERLRKDKIGFIPYCDNAIGWYECKKSWRKKCFKNCQDFVLNETKYKDVFETDRV